MGRHSGVQRRGDPGRRSALPAGAGRAGVRTGRPGQPRARGHDAGGRLRRRGHGAAPRARPGHRLRGAGGGLAGAAARAGDHPVRRRPGRLRPGAERARLRRRPAAGHQRLRGDGDLAQAGAPAGDRGPLARRAVAAGPAGAADRARRPGGAALRRRRAASGRGRGGAADRRGRRAGRRRAVGRARRPLPGGHHAGPGVPGAGRVRAGRPLDARRAGGRNAARRAPGGAPVPAGRVGGRPAASGALAGRAGRAGAARAAPAPGGDRPRPLEGGRHPVGRARPAARCACYAARVMTGAQRTRTKLVATLGPASSDAAVIGAMVDAGLDVARLNFSHGEPAEHRERLSIARRAATECGASLAVLADLQGPKIRVGVLAGDGYPLPAGASCELIAGASSAPPPAIPVTYGQLADDLRPGDRVLLDDGAIELEVRSVSGRRVACVVRRGGTVRSRKGVNLPGVRVSAPSLTAKDRKDLVTAIGAGVDYLALSFVRRAGDVTGAKRAIAELGADVPLVAKLERPEAIEHLDGILDAADAVMVARGDLGVELAVEKVPPLQKEIIARANACGVPVITATQMLESMVSSQRPTRAEASDVANAVFDGTDAVMLSQETAIGAYPVEAVATMRRIAEEAESTPSLLHPPPPPSGGPLDVASTTCKAAVQAAADLGARAIVAFTETGATARYVSRFRPRVPIVGLTPHEATRRRMAMYWGVRALPPVDPHLEMGEMVQQADQRLRAAGVASEGDLIVLVAGTPGLRAATNRMIVHRLGSADVTQTSG